MEFYWKIVKFILHFFEVEYNITVSFHKYESPLSSATHKWLSSKYVSPLGSATHK